VALHLPLRQLVGK